MTVHCANPLTERLTLCGASVEELLVEMGHEVYGYELFLWHEAHERCGGCETALSIIEAYNKAASEELGGLASQGCALGRVERDAECHDVAGAEPHALPGGKYHDLAKECHDVA